MTALAGTIGIGNIAGVATAITVGGLGALFWMWVTALVGMATKFAEAILALKYRSQDSSGEMVGGPMVFIKEGLGWKSLALSFAFFGAIAAFGGGNMLQANTVADVMGGVFGVNPWVSGIVMSLLCGVTLLGGIKSIGRVTSYLVPLMALIYLSGGCAILLLKFDQIPQVLINIVSSAFNGQAATGGFLGASMALALQVGISRGLMTSEAGLGTASIAAAAAKSDHPGRQAMVSMTGSFLSTVLMCTMTALILGVTGVQGIMGIDGKALTGASLTTVAFEQVLPGGVYFVAIGLLLFAFTTILGWAYYGEKCLEELLGIKAVPFYRVLFSLIVIPGAVLELDIVWKLSDIMNGLMAFPNLIGLVALTPVVIRETNDFLKLLEKEKRAASQPGG
jgi:AGCS family alanine or glycine:cation symporter